MKLSPQPELFDIKAAAGEKQSLLCWTWLLWFMSCLSHDLKCACRPRRSRPVSSQTIVAFSHLSADNKRFPDTNRPPRTKHVVNGLSYQTTKPSFKLKKPQSTDT